MTIGIYCLQFPNTDKVYIGQSIMIEARYKAHLSRMKNGRSSIALNKAFIEYGAPSMSILEVVEEPKLLEKLEEEYIIEFDSIKNGFNTCNNYRNVTSATGENSEVSLYDNDTYEDIFNLLCDTDLTITEIARELNVSRGIVQSMSSGFSHLWLKDKYPEKYIILQNKNNCRRIGGIPKFEKDRYIEALTYLATTNLSISEVGKLVNLEYQIIKRILNGTLHLWLVEESPELYEKMLNNKDRGKHYPSVYSPEGVKYDGITNIAEFARQHNLNRSSLAAVLGRRAKTHKGWSLREQFTDSTPK